MPDSSQYIGHLAPGAIQDSLPGRTIEFIWSCLIPWRDDPERETAEAEEELNAQFHNFLQSQAIDEFPMVVFQLEERQEGRRRVDLSAKPKHAIWIESRLYSKYTPFLVIEGKRLPAPSHDREREYVSGGEKRSGGIQRFKLGLHGKDHETTIILGYLQQGKPQEWRSRINGWISELAESHPDDWADHELLATFPRHRGSHKARTTSVHPRVEGCKTSEIRILHFWVQLSPALKTITATTSLDPQAATRRKNPSDT